MTIQRVTRVTRATRATATSTVSTAVTTPTASSATTRPAAAAVDTTTSVGRAKAIAINPANTTQALVCWSTGKLASVGGARLPTANPPVILDAGESVVDFTILEWGTPAGYMLTSHGKVWPIGGAPGVIDAIKTVKANYAVALAVDPNGGNGYWIGKDSRVRAFGGATAIRFGPSWGEVRDWSFDWATKRFMVLYADGFIAVSSNASTVAHACSAKARLKGSTIARSLTYNWATGEGYVLDGHGRLHAVGNAPELGVTEPGWPGWDIARDIAFASWGAIDTRRYVVLDGLGGTHPRTLTTPPEVAVTAPAGTDASFTLTFAAPPDNGGTFRIQWKNRLSTPIPVDADADALAVGMESLRVGIGNFEVSGASPDLTAQPAEITWTGSLGGQPQPLPRVIVDTNNTLGAPTVAEGTVGALGTVDDTTMPVIEWTYSDTENDVQAEWEVQVWDYAQIPLDRSRYPAADAAPPATTGEVKPAWATTGRGADVRRVKVDEPLTEGTYRAYVRAREAFGKWSAWAHRTFVLDWTGPVEPEVTLAADSLNARITATIANAAVYTAGELFWWRRRLAGSTDPWDIVRSSAWGARGSLHHDSFNRDDANDLEDPWGFYGDPLGIRDEAAEGLPAVGGADSFRRLHLYGHSYPADVQASDDPGGLSDHLREIMDLPGTVEDAFDTDTSGVITDDFSTQGALGDPWLVQAGRWYSTGSSAYLGQPASTNKSRAIVDVGAANHAVFATLGGTPDPPDNLWGNNWGLRAGVAANGYGGVRLVVATGFDVAVLYAIDTDDGATGSTLIPTIPFTPAANQRWGLVVVGDQVYVLLDGVVMDSATIPANSQGTGMTHAGMWAGEVGDSARWVDFEALPVASAPDDWEAISGTWKATDGVASLVAVDPLEGPSVLARDMATPDGYLEMTLDAAAPDGSALVARCLNAENMLALQRKDAETNWGLYGLLSGTPVLLAEATGTAEAGDTVGLQVQGRWVRARSARSWIDLGSTYEPVNGDFSAGTDWSAGLGSLGIAGGVATLTTGMSGTASIIADAAITVLPGESVGFKVSAASSVGTGHYAQVFVELYDETDTLISTIYGPLSPLSGTATDVSVMAVTTDETTSVIVGLLASGAAGAGDEIDLTDFTHHRSGAYRLPAAYDALAAGVHWGIAAMDGVDSATTWSSASFEETFQHPRSGSQAQGPGVFGSGTVADLLRTETGLTPDDAAVLVWGINDAILGSGAAHLARQKHALTAAIARLRTRWIEPALDTYDAGVGDVGTWGDPDYFYDVLPGISSSTPGDPPGSAPVPVVLGTVNDRKVVTLPADYAGEPIVVGLIGMDTGRGGTAEIAVDGVVKATVSTDGVAAGAALGRPSSIVTARITGLFPGATTVSITATAIGASSLPKGVLIDYVAVEAAEGPQVALANVANIITSEQGVADIFSTTTIGVSGAGWTVDEWAGDDVTIYDGTGAGQTRTILSNTADTLTVSVAWGTTPDATSAFIIPDGTLWGEITPVDVAAFNEAYAEVVADFATNEVRLLDMDAALGSDPANFDDDGLHPNAIGASLIASAAATALTPEGSYYEAGALVEVVGDLAEGVSAIFTGPGGLVLGTDNASAPTKGIKVTWADGIATVWQGIGGAWVAGTLAAGDPYASDTFNRSDGIPNETDGANTYDPSAWTVTPNTGAEIVSNALEGLEAYASAGHDIAETKMVSYDVLDLGDGLGISLGSTATVDLWVTADGWMTLVSGANKVERQVTIAPGDRLALGAALVDGATVMAIATINGDTILSTTATVTGDGTNVLLALGARVDDYAVDEAVITADAWQAADPEAAMVTATLIEVTADALLIDGVEELTFAAPYDISGTISGFFVSASGARVDTFDLTSTAIGFHDYEAIPGEVYDYEAWTSSPNGEIRSTVVEVGSVTAPRAGYWLKDPLAPERNMRVRFSEDDISITRTEEQGVFEPPGREDAVVVGGVLRSARLSDLSLSVVGDAARDALLTLLESRRVLLLQSPYEMQWYIRNGPTVTTNIIMAELGDAQRLYSIPLSGAIEVGAP